MDKPAHKWKAPISRKVRAAAGACAGDLEIVDASDYGRLMEFRKVGIQGARP